MLKILIYTSEKAAAASIGNTINEALRRARCSFEISTYYAVGKAKQHIDSDAYFFDVLLLDADDSQSYILAQTVRRINLQASIIFIGGGSVDMYTILKYRPSGFICDWRSPAHILEAFRTAYQEQVNIGSFFTVKNKDSIYKINYRDIRYFESNQRIITLHTFKKTSNISFYAKLDDIYEKLPHSHFVKCHQSFIVNMEAIKKLDKVSRRFTLYSGEAIDISKRAYADVVALFETFEFMLK